MKHTARRVLAVTAFAVLAGAIEERALAQVRTTAHVDTIFTFPCSPEPISVRFVGDLTFVTTYHRDASGTLVIARQHVAARFNHYIPRLARRPPMTTGQYRLPPITPRTRRLSLEPTGSSTPSAVAGRSSVTWDGSSSTVRSTTSPSSISSGQLARLT